MLDKHDSSHSFLSYGIGTVGLMVSDWLHKAEVNFADISHIASIGVGIMSGLIILGRFVHDYLYYSKKVWAWFHSKG